MTALSQSLTWTRRNLLRLRREPRSFISAVVIPVVFFLGFYAVLQRLLEAQTVDYAQFLAPAIVVQALMFAAMSTGYWAGDDVATGILARARSLPISRVGVVAGRLLADLVRALVSIAVVVAIGAAFGFRFEAGLLGALGFVALALLFVAAIGAGCAWVGLAVADTERIVSLLSIPYLPLFMLSTALVPADLFPSWLEPLVVESPISRTVEGLRALAGDGQGAEPVLIATVWLLGLLLAFGLGAASAFRRTA